MKNRANCLYCIKFLVLILVVFFIINNLSILHAAQSKLSKTPQSSSPVNLTVRAQIVAVERNPKNATYTIWRNGQSYLTVNNEHNPKGILPPGNYTLLVSPGGSVTITLETNIRQEDVILWGRCNAVVNPLYEGNQLVIASPVTINSATYDGTKGMAVKQGINRFLYLLSAHNIVNPGPKVLDGAGRTVGKTLAGQTLPAGIYTVMPERGTADGIVYGEIRVTIN